MKRRHACPILVCLAANFLFASGCGGDRGLVPVSGTITFDGGPMPGEGRLRFIPLKPAKGYARRPGRAKFDRDGKYRAQSFEPGDGLFPGEYAVMPYCWETEQVMGGPPAKTYLPERYTNELDPPFRLTVEEGKSRVPFDMKIEP